MQIFRKNSLAFLVLALGLAQAGSAGAALLPPGAVEVNIATYKVLYEFKLLSADSSAGLSSVDGKMYFEQDDTCDAWTTDRRFATKYFYSEHESDQDNSHYISFESKDGQQFSFSSERQESGEVTEQLRGALDVTADGTAHAVYSRPEGTSYNLPEGYLFPTRHSIEMIRHARAGDRFYKAPVFDGTDADGPVEVSTFIGKKATASEIKKIAARHKKVDAGLLTPDAWYIRVAVFPLKDTAEMLPSYEMEMLMHDNGVVSDVIIDYGSFRIAQKMVALERLPAKVCP